jgi:hypothetical protein
MVDTVPDPAFVILTDGGHRDVDATQSQSAPVMGLATAARMKRSLREPAPPLGAVSHLGVEFPQVRIIEVEPSGIGRHASRDSRKRVRHPARPLSSRHDG